MSEKNRYSDEELAMFKALIEKKIEAAKIDLDGLKASLSHKDDNGTDDTIHSFNMMEDGAGTLTREEISQLAQRQEKFLTNLENALMRIQNKTYGICRVTGKLIQKERLMAVPHATLSMEAKEAQG
jgi:DnaK suppressor protein